MVSRLEVENIEFRYKNRNVTNQRFANIESSIRDISFKMDSPGILGIVGPNGAGKTTLLRCISRILKPVKGRVMLNGVDIWSIERKEMAKFIGYISQPFNFMHISVFDLVLAGRTPYFSWFSRDKDIDKVVKILHLLDLENLAMRKYSELSSGQQQKVLIARLLVQNPDFVLMDEPTANLDIKHQLEVMEIIKNLVSKNNLKVIMAIHDLNLALKYADKIAMMKDGTIYKIGETASVLTPEIIEEVFEVEVELISHNGGLYVSPKTKQHKAGLLKEVQERSSA
ncbi:MAG: ABC transporter ATP-binding protein [Candidatus Methanoliparum thermophilum]|uniref:ABC transporter ATP-binding protein n=1 Tax=Methanoliparum thermophilum TaxID=2491083 RepID=A0A520KTC5_METT2|nr:ABC transporter ATP-binding protein [Candidatus Methanoliparum sp. LAM-1]RZN65243.1 MAG: ABC transporter ATP-binding protein [Candidatus Methanoliparum thermophilum]BDC36568.1 ABC transporter ATP-binding protein [Candidatus Methanoliparum sp. LAM-1]